MELLKALEEYTISQKFVGTSFTVVGFLLLALSIIGNFTFSQTELLKGLKIGSLVCGLLILVGGLGYRSFSSKIEQSQTKLYNQSKNEFIEQESVRMKKVVKYYPIYQIAFGFLIIISILVVWFVKSPFWSGIAFSVIILFTAVMIIEANSHKSIMKYKTEIEKE